MKGSYAQCICAVRYTEGVFGKKSKVFGVDFLNIGVCFLQNLLLKQFNYCHRTGFSFKMGSLEMLAVWKHITSIVYVFLPVKPKWPSDNTGGAGTESEI